MGIAASCPLDTQKIHILHQYLFDEHCHVKFETIRSSRHSHVQKLANLIHICNIEPFTYSSLNFQNNTRISTCYQHIYHLHIYITNRTNSPLIRVKYKHGSSIHDIKCKDLINLLRHLYHDRGELRRPYKLFFSLKQYPGGNLKSGVAYLYTHLLLYLHIQECIRYVELMHHHIHNKRDS